MGIKFGEKERRRHELKQFVIGTYTAEDLIAIIESARQHLHPISEGVEDILKELKLFVE